MDTLTLVLVMMTHRGDFLAQRSLPYIDALPLAHPHRSLVIHHYLTRAEKECQKESDDCWWAYKAATGLMLKDMPLGDTDATAYLLGRMMGRHFNWQQDLDGSWRWIDAGR